jgi:hypothetical protein
MVLPYPGLPHAEVEIIPREPGRSWDAYLWATGMAPPFLNAVERSDGYQLIRSAWERYELGGERARLRVRLGLHSHEDDPSIRDAMEKRVSDSNEEINRLDTLIREFGGVIKDA